MAHNIGPTSHEHNGCSCHEIHHSTHVLYIIGLWTGCCENRRYFISGEYFWYFTINIVENTSPYFTNVRPLSYYFVVIPQLRYCGLFIYTSIMPILSVNIVLINAFGHLLHMKDCEIVKRINSRLVKPRSVWTHVLPHSWYDCLRN